MKFNFIKYRKLYYVFSGILILLSAISLMSFGLKPGIDLAGGSIIDLSFAENRPSNQEIEEKLKDFNLGEIVVQPVGDKEVIIRIKDINEGTHQEILKKFEGVINSGKGAGLIQAEVRLIDFEHKSTGNSELIRKLYTIEVPSVDTKPESIVKALDKASMDLSENIRNDVGKILISKN